jgi:type I restriction enzyme R subunit
VLANLVALVKFAIRAENHLEPFPDSVRRRFQTWIDEQYSNGASFTEDQVHWLTEIADHIATSVEITPEDLDSLPFSRQGGLGRAYELFGDRLVPLLDELNEVLVQ